MPVKRNAARIDFVGIVWADGRPCIFWPKGMSDAARNATPPRLLVDVFRRADKSKRLQHTLREVGGHIEFPVELEVLENYLEQGLYETRETRFTRSQSGKVDWRRTIQGQVPSFGKNNVPMYLEPISPCQSSADHMIRQIHSYVVGVCDRSFSWLLTLSGNPVAQVHHSKRLPVTINQAVAMIRRELYEEFNDTRKNQLHLLLRFFRKQASDRRSSSGLIGTDFFHVVWEEMCGVYFGSQNSSVGYTATPSYFYASREVFSNPVVRVGQISCLRIRNVWLSWMPNIMTSLRPNPRGPIW